MHSGSGHASSYTTALRALNESNHNDEMIELKYAREKIILLEDKIKSMDLMIETSLREQSERAKYLSSERSK